MNNKQLYAIVIVLVVVIAGAGVAVLVMKDDNNNGGSVTVTDSLGREVTVDDTDSIFCIGACSLRLVSYFDAVDDVCAMETEGTFNWSTGQTYYVVYQDFFESLPESGTDAESVAVLNPSVVITSTLADVAAADTFQDKCGCPVYVINADVEFDADYFYEQITSLGDLFGEKARATELNSGIKAIISSIESAVSTSSSTAYACGMFYYGGSSLLKASGNYLPFDYSDVTNVMPGSSNKQPYTITLETLCSYDPDYIFIDNVNISSVLSTIRTDITDNTGLEDVSAIENDKIYSTMIYKYYGTNWDNQLINAYFIATLMDSDSTWTFEDMANNVLELFYGDDAVTYEALAEIQGGCAKVVL